MPRTKKGTPPSYRRHSCGQAVVTVRLISGGRRDLLLGPWDSDASHEEYARILLVLRAHQGRFPDGTATQAAGQSVNEIILLWWKQAEAQRGADDKELHQYRYAL